MYGIRRRKRDVIVLGDLYAKSSFWGSLTEDARGAYLIKRAAVLDSLALNNGDTATLVRGERADPT